MGGKKVFTGFLKGESVVARAERIATEKGYFKVYKARYNEEGKCYEWGNLHFHCAFPTEEEAKLFCEHNQGCTC